MAYTIGPKCFVSRQDLELLYSPSKWPNSLHGLVYGGPILTTGSSPGSSSSKLGGVFVPRGFGRSFEAEDLSQSHQKSAVCLVGDFLGGGFKYVSFSPLPGEMIQFD